ncbi:P-loop containing nucleoside triphosphate hydrolase protein [Serendipita vermifera]|nr:P-loop containing nucleoside triphosphate hydrolase protein [Serendipita vermifera]
MSERHWTNIMLIGDPGVGKRSVRRRYFNDELPSRPFGHLPTTSKKGQFSLDSSPILPNGQLKHHAKLRTMIHRISTGWRSSQQLVDMNIYFYILSYLPITEPLDRDMARRFMQTEVVAICYDCSKPETLYNAIYKWYPIVLHHIPAVPIFLLGCKSDQMRGLEQAEGQFITTEAEKAARQIGAIDAFECSAEEGYSVYSAIH